MQRGTCRTWLKTPTPHPCPERLLTSGFMELQGDVSIKSEAEVIVEDIQRKLQEWTNVKVTLFTAN